MFNKLSLLALLAPLVAGLSVNIPENPTSAGTVTIVWDSTPGKDPATFSIELINVSFNNAFAIANNVVPELGQMTITLPVVPVGDGYTLELVDVGNINNVFATSGTFSIGPNGATSVSSGTSSSTASSSTRSSSASHTSSTAPATTHSTGSSTAFGTTITPSTSSTPSGSSSDASASASSAASAPLKMNSNVGAFAAVLFSAIAGAAIVAL